MTEFVLDATKRDLLLLCVSVPFSPAYYCFKSHHIIVSENGELLTAHSVVGPVL